jgi:hypothetical protein
MLLAVYADKRRSVVEEKFKVLQGLAEKAAARLVKSRHQVLKMYQVSSQRCVQ